MIAVAVTGGIGSGKSTFAAHWAARGAVVVDSDRLAREVVAPGTDGLTAVVEAFGPGVLTEAGEVDRPALASVVFGDPAARRRLEAIVHPRVRAEFTRRRDAAGPDAIVVNDIPLLTQLGVAAGFHLVVGVGAPVEVRVPRLIARGLAEADARARIAAQISDADRAPLCDLWVVNGGPERDLADRADQIWDDRLVPFADNVLTGRRAERRGPWLAPPDPSWGRDAVRLGARVDRAVGGARVDHIGSTAVPGMPAKDVIDLQLTVPDLATARRWADGLTRAGFPSVPGITADTPHPEAADPREWTKRLHANADPGRSLNLHLRVRDSPGWRWSLLFRDWITADPAARAEYLAVKQRAAARHLGDGTTDGYADAKETWLAQAWDRSRAWADRAGWVPGPGMDVGTTSN